MFVLIKDHKISVNVFFFIDLSWISNLKAELCIVYDAFSLQQKETGILYDLLIKWFFLCVLCKSIFKCNKRVYRSISKLKLVVILIYKKNNRI